MNKNEICALLERSGIAYELVDHPAVYTMEDLAALSLPHPEAEAKNLFLRDDKRNYLLLTIPGEKRVNLKAFQKANRLRKLSFGSAEDLEALLRLHPGSVTPLGLLNDPDGKIPLYLDRELEHKLLGIHPNENTATLYLCFADLISLLKSQGHQVIPADVPG
ncbi:MAG: prolyl-tRNA synthetase associated domain-containing protein [Firmicutes bacterium]|nr:prolyl-tRNA synthetase associated domain-containing protein [Bacillota bacterium]